jgi:glycosyltransferase involved in cell wall biosynthesis
MFMSGVADVVRTENTTNQNGVGTRDGGGSEPLVSVIIPAFQCAQYIAQAIESVLAQSYSNLEIIVVNDGSPDTQLLEQALTPYLHTIRYLKQATSGPASARNTAIRQANGIYVAFLDSDDYWSTEHLSRQLSLFREDPTLDLVYCDYMLLKNDKPFARAFDMQPQIGSVTFESLLVEDCAIGTSTAVCSRACIVKSGLFDESLLRCEDFEMWLRMVLFGARMTYNSDVQVFHRINEAGLSADKWSMKRDRIRVYQKMASDFPLSERQKEIARQLIARTEADCHVDELKHALERGDFITAVSAARNATAAKANWKVRGTLLGLRIMPALFRRFYLVRSFLQRNAQYSVPKPQNQSDLIENGTKSQSDKTEVMAGGGGTK